MSIEEYDRLGGDEFLSRYGFGRPQEYVLWHDGRTYDSKAVLGVSRKFASGTPATSDQFSGGRTGAVRLLTDLGFHVTSTDAYDESSRPVTGDWREASDVGSEAAQSAWAEAARDVLLQAARRYRAVVTDEELATQVMYRTGIRTDQPAFAWSGDVLHGVSDACAARGEPRLSALCVDAGGHAIQGSVDDRLACYRHFRAVGLPAGGGSAPRTRKATAARAPAKKATPSRTRLAPSRRPDPPPAATCPSCYMALPVTGECDSCG